MNAPIMLTVRETALRAGVPVHAVRQWLQHNCIYSVRSGNRFYISWASVVRFLEGNQITADPFSVETRHN